MNFINTLSFFTIMLTLAIIPSTSVALVVTRSATLNVKNGVAVALGIVTGDIVFILLVLFGLSFVAETMIGLFIAIKYIGGTYLLWIGYTLLRSNKSAPISVTISEKKGGLFTSFFAGLIITLGDIKAIFFYVSLLPTIVNLASLKSLDLILIIVITIVTVGGVKIVYAFFAKVLIEKSNNLNTKNTTKKIAGSFMVGAGSYLILKA